MRCRAVDAPSPLGLCTACVVNTRVELSSGFRRIEQYLAAWAAFDQWLVERKDDGV